MGVVQNVFSVIFSHVYFSFFSFSIFQLWIAGSTIYLLSNANDDLFSVMPVSRLFAEKKTVGKDQGKEGWVIHVLGTVRLSPVTRKQLTDVSYQQITYKIYSFLNFKINVIPPDRNYILFPCHKPAFMAGEFPYGERPYNTSMWPEAF